MYNKSSYSLSLIAALLICCQSFGQRTSKIEYDSINKELIESLRLMNRMYDMGVIYQGDSLYKSDEFNKVINSKEYRKLLYPTQYNWELVKQLLEQNKLKMALWHLINLYHNNPLNKENVLQIIITYSPIYDMSKVITATFYTYCFLDPEIGNIENGKPEIIRPDILELKFQSLREIVSYIISYQSKIKNTNKQ